MPILALLFLLLVGGWIEGIVEHWQTVVTVLIYIAVSLLALLGLAALVGGLTKDTTASRAAGRTARAERMRRQAQAREQIQDERVAHTKAKEQLQDAYDQANRDMDRLLDEWR